MRKVALVGFAPTTMRKEFPPDVEVWTLNHAWYYGITKIDRLFEIHNKLQLTGFLNRAMESDEGWETRHWQWLHEKHDFPIYMMERDPEIPSSARYPLEEILADLFGEFVRGDGDDPLTFMTSSFSYMCGMAIYERVDEIGIYGFEMATESEYSYQREGLFLLAGLAAGRGIKVRVHEKSTILRAKLYAYEGGQLVSRQTLEVYLRNYENQHAEWLGRFNQRKAVFEERLRAYSKLANPTEEQAKDLQTVQAAVDEAWTALMRAEGAIQSVQHLIANADLQEPELELQALTMMKTFPIGVEKR